MRYMMITGAILYVAAIVITAGQAGRVVAFLVAVFGAACLTLAFAAAGSSDDVVRGARPASRRRRRA